MKLFLLALTLGIAMTASAEGKSPARSAATAPTVTENDEEIRIATPALEAAVRKTGYVSGVAGGTFLDRKTGFRDAGFGLDIVDWIMEPGSDEAYRDQLPGDLPYEFNNLFHGAIPKRSVEGPQICTQVKRVFPQVIRGKDFVAVRTRHRYTLAAPGKVPGSGWEQTLVFPAGERYFLSSDRITSANAGDELFLRLDMPGHIRHDRGDTFSEVYLSYAGRIPASAFSEDFPPDARYRYRRGAGELPKRFIRAYRLHDPKTGKEGPWLAGMTLDPAAVYEAWCHQRGYVCMIEEIGGRKVKAGDSFGAAFLVGYFDSIAEMHRTYDRYAGHDGLEATEAGWRLTASGTGRAAMSGPNPVETEEERVARKLEWFRDQKFGLFVHWGIYSQWGVIESWPLVEEDTWARPDGLKPWEERGRDMERFQRDYRALNRTFNPTKFDPERWADAAKAAGMRYFVFTTKHHDGFNMYDTRQTDYRITHPDTPFSRDPRADVTRALFDAFRKKGFGIGAYYSKADWHHADYWDPSTPARTRNPNYDTLKRPEKWARFRDFVHRQIGELTSDYGKIDILWLDAGQVRPPTQDLHMDRLAALARSRQPDLLIVDRTVGGKYENYRTPEQEVPDKPLDFPWESCITMGTQWSYKPDDEYKSTRTLIHLLVDVVAKGGNLLLNVGPTPEGELPPESLSRLKEIGQWMKVNGEAIHGTRPVAPYKEGNVAYTRKGRNLYAIFMRQEDAYPPAEVRVPFRPAPGTKVRLLGRRDSLTWREDGDGCRIMIPSPKVQAAPFHYAFTLKLTSDDS
jgi:alpha-L-fucosidase